MGNTEKSEFSEEFKRTVEANEARIKNLENLYLYLSEYVKSLGTWP